MTSMHFDDATYGFSRQDAQELLQRASALLRNPNPSELALVRDQLEARIVACNQRLRMLSDWITRGLLLEAVSVDTAYGGFCKIVSELNFGNQQLQWDQLCTREGIALNTRIDESALLILDDAVADAKQIDRPAEVFQLAVLQRQPLGLRVQHLRKLFMSAPQNPALKALAKRYEVESLASLEASCNEAAETGRVDVLRAALEAIDGLRWQSHFSNEFIDSLRSNIKRHEENMAAEQFDALAARIEAAFANRNLEAIGLFEDQFELIRTGHGECLGVEPSDMVRQRTSLAFDWASSERDRLRHKFAHEESCESMRRALDRHDSYLEIEPLHGQVLSHDLGIPDDLLMRFATLHKAWELSQRRAHRRWIGVSTLVGIVIVAIIAVFVYKSNQRTTGEARAREIMALVDAGDFATAENLRDAMKEKDAWMLEISAVQAALARIDKDKPVYLERRKQVAVILELAHTIALATNPPSTESELRIQIDLLKVALKETEFLRKLTETELSVTQQRIDELGKANATRRDNIVALRRSEFAELKRRRANLPHSDDDRPPLDRVDAKKTELYLADLVKLEGDIKAFAENQPAESSERSDTQPLLDGLMKDIKGVTVKLERLNQFTVVWVKLSTVPISEPKYAEIADVLLNEFREILTTRGRGEVEMLQGVKRMCQSSMAIEHWREVVLPAIAVASQGRVLIPADRAKAGEVRTVLDAHVGAFKESPYLQLALRWIALCNIVEKCTATSLGLGALEAVEKKGWIGLQQVEISGVRWAYCRDAGPNAGILGGLVRSLPDLVADPKTLRTDMKLREEVKSARVAAPFSQYLEDAKGAIMSDDVVLVRQEWLKTIQSIAQSKDTDPIASAAVALGMLRIYQDTLAERLGIDKAMCEKIRRILQDFSKVENADWPRLALLSAKKPEQEQARADAVKALVQIRSLANEAEAMRKSWIVEKEQSVGPRLVGVLLPANSAGRATAPATLSGRYLVLQTQGKPETWRLATIEVDRGLLKSGGSSAPQYSLIYSKD